MFMVLGIAYFKNCIRETLNKYKYRGKLITEKRIKVAIPSN
jgi:hypothetical protein